MAVAAVQVDLDLLEDALAVRMPVLVDDLDGVLGARVDVAAGVHDAVGALAQLLACQRVDVREAVGLHVGGEATLLLPGHRLVAVAVAVTVVAVVVIVAAVSGAVAVGAVVVLFILVFFFRRNISF